MQFEPRVTLQTPCFKTVGNLCHFLSTDGLFEGAAHTTTLESSGDDSLLLGIGCFLSLNNDRHSQ